MKKLCFIKLTLVIFQIFEMQNCKVKTQDNKKGS